MSEGDLDTDNTPETGAINPAGSRAEHFHVVGVGASAGGLEALEQFFEHMPEDSGLCFVVVQHLSPDFKSMMDELLARRTRIPIIRAEDGMEIHPNSIYLMPPRKEMILSRGKLLLTDKDPSQALALPIDRFLRSLAHDCGSRSIGVILSGTGSDGSRGIRDIHDANGLVVAQSEGSAKFDGMPRSARETGLVDLDLPAVDMPDAILKFVGLRRFPQLGDEQSAVPAVGMQAIFRMLRREYGIDFSQYKPSTLMRRVERRLLLNQSPSVEAYVDELTEKPEELNQLYKDLMIGVTQFFRDQDAFARLAKEILPRLLAAVAENQEFRVWVAGCSTGEEPYSIAMLIYEHLESMSQRPTVRIFATDAHRASLDFASTGLYSEEAMKNVSPERREQFFIRRPDGYQVVPHIRKMIVFAPHDLLKDAPFTRLDFVTCRNLLIYLQVPVQKKVISLYHFGLKTGGIMFLGPSESPGDLSDEFESIDDHWKIYRKRRDIRLRPDFRLILPSAPAVRTQPNLPYTASTLASERFQQSIYDRLLEEHLPPSFLINDRKELIHTFGGAGKYLRLSNGRASTQFLDLVDSELKMILIGALARAEKQLVPVVFTDIRVADDKGLETLSRLTVKPLSDRVSGLTSFLIILEDIGRTAPPRDESTIDMGIASREHVLTLEQELRHTRENLQAMIEEQESSNEELQATNEELVASNEQLQSTNEELHSVNEELYTVNAEYQHKIDELTQVKADLENLLLASDVGILFLDRNLCIRRFTPLVGKMFNLLPHDAGRSIASFANFLDESLIESMQEVLRTGTPFEKEILLKNGNYYFQRILPYRISSASIDGIVLSLIDISPLKRAEVRSQYLSAIVESSADAIVGRDLDGTIVSWNRGAEEIYGYKLDDVAGRNASLLYPPDSRDQFEAGLQSIREGESFSEEQQRRRQDGNIIDVLYTVSPIRDSSGSVVGSSSIARDITDRRQAQRDLEQSIRNRDQFLAMLSHELRNPLGAIQNAAQFLERLGSADEKVLSAYRVVRRQAEQMRLLLDDLLDVARVTQNKIVFRREPCFLSAIVKEAIEATLPLINSRGQQLQTEGLALPLKLDGDPARLQQAIVNLLKNASKYSPEKSTIEIRICEESGQAVIRVVDHGVGIPPEMLGRIFDLFVQSNDTLDRSDGGMGVGLTLVKAIVEHHGGTVAASSGGHNKGSEFTVRLPVLTGDDDAPAAPPHNDSKEKSPASPLRIAIVEDNSDSRTMLQSLLQLDGHEVRIAIDGKLGIELITGWQPDVAIIDIGLPGLDGFEVAKSIRAAGLQKPPLLIALTGYGFAADREKAKAAGFDVHLVKPLRRTELDAILGDTPSFFNFAEKP